MRKKVALVITDGIGFNESSEWNAFYYANKPNYEWLFKNAPYSFLSTFGKDIGLPEGQMGNSEVGHMCIGAGRVLYQDLVKISLSLENKTLEQNPNLLSFIDKLEVVHLCGLVSDGGVHSHISHMIGLAKILESKGKIVYIHAITDGRDVPPFSASKFIKQILEIESKNIILATISGRYYAMDRDNRWDRIKIAYECLIKASNPQKNPLEYIQSQFNEDISDEFIIPASFNNFSGIKNNEGFIFTNFRSDRAREIIKALGIDDFSEFEREKRNIKILCMCEYDASFTFPILFPKEHITNTLSEILSQNNLSQAHIAETEKYAHVTFFFNGGKEEPLKNEVRLLIPSPKVKTYDLKPEMSAKEVCNATLNSMDNENDFIVVNFANGDMVGHTGNFEAAIKAVEAVDFELGRIISKAKEKGYSLIITSDHGNCEKMKDESGNLLTNHTAGYVWCFIIDGHINRIDDGGLDNIAPSILKLFDLEIPSSMSKPLF
ncbi:2,3-bisphosphoglycerate-independent phosphoglycerate mutase [Helicobacter sp. MIT 14-3879]|uniref:2,3-bisphosphoglycerate-independent phosphoglycerate mutase n=1 Tax=Helicobacter sp. MIT 14-3879 TaxID=2040649 RepID=UPI000E1F418D|nr:2,3-bisphosphoglycerate-independent phosphoglycerate mutase [Helicobacter sp. MIT 14-3879]RDU60931.1 phosphoglycerate mutase (2,3-diphosphoglycerate-independent) [Helicobacter sp. MIT 14-3879]